MKHHVAKSRELRAEILGAGGVLLRKDGDHHWYKLPNGERVCLPFGGGHTDSSSSAARKVRRAIERSEAPREARKENGR